MVNPVYGAMDIEAKREAMGRVHAYVNCAAAAQPKPGSRSHAKM